MRHVRASIAAIIVLWLPAGAAEAADADTQRARALFDEAGELERYGQWTAAQERLHAALRLRETPQLHFALAWALENDDRLLEARSEYDLATRLGRDRPGADEAVRLATARLIDLEKKMPSIRLHLTGSARSGARILVDGHEVRRDDSAATAAVNPGAHVVRIERGSTVLLEEIVYVGRSMEQTLDANLGDAVAERDTTRERHVSEPAIPAPAATNERGEKVFPWLVLAGGVACAGGAAALLISANTDSTDSQRTKESAGLVLGGVGILGATVGAVLLLRGERPPEKPAPRARASATPIPGGALATAVLSF